MGAVFNPEELRGWPLRTFRGDPPRERCDRAGLPRASARESKGPFLGLSRQDLKDRFHDTFVLPEWGFYGDDKIGSWTQARGQDLRQVFF